MNHDRAMRQAVITADYYLEAAKAMIGPKAANADLIALCQVMAIDNHSSLMTEIGEEFQYQLQVFIEEVRRVND